MSATARIRNIGESGSIQWKSIRQTDQHAGQRQETGQPPQMNSEQGGMGQPPMGSGLRGQGGMGQPPQEVRIQAHIDSQNSKNKGDSKKKKNKQRIIKILITNQERTIMREDSP